MPAAAIDSGVLIDDKDTSASDRHERAGNIVLAIDRGELPTVHVTDYVVLEALTWIHERNRHIVAVDLPRRVRAEHAPVRRHAGGASGTA